MSDKVKISDLPTATTVNNTDWVAIVQGGVTKKAAAEKLPATTLPYTPENIANKVAAWTTPVNNTRYPSEKLVKDSLDTKAAANHTHAATAVTYTTPNNQQGIQNAKEALDALFNGVVHGHTAQQISYSNPYNGSANIYDALNTLFDSNIPSWADKDWPDSYTVMHNGALYWSNDVISVGEPAPGISTKWVLLIQPTSMTGAQIVTALELLSINNCLNSSKVKYGDGVSVTSKIGIMDAALNNKQGMLYHRRIIIEGVFATPGLTIPGTVFPIYVSVNRVPYIGKQGASFTGELAGYDFRYQHIDVNTVITTNPTFNPQLTFNPGDVVDILHSGTAIQGDPTP